MTLNEFLFTAMGAIISAMITVISMYVRHHLSSDGKKLDEAGVIRKELRVRCEKLEARIDTLITDNEKWRERYFSETQELNNVNLKLRQDISALTIQLQDVKERFIPKKRKDSYQ